MPDHRENSPINEGRRVRSALPPALLLSIAVHAAAGGLFAYNWHVAPVDLPKPLMVTLEAAAAPAPAAELPPAPVEPAPKKIIASQRALPAPPVHQHVTPSPVAVERVETVPPVVAPAPVAAPAPVMIAKSPSPVSVPQAADAIEPPHFDVAYLNNPKPAYPPMARRLGLEGLVVLRVQVNPKGVPEQVAVAQTSGMSMLDEAASKAVQSWTFVPARRGETPIAHAVDVPIRFQLKN
jgi:protein TonB